MGNITIQGDLTGDVPGGEVGGASNLTTVGAIPYVSAAKTLNQDPTALFWDAANDRLGVGRNNPSTVLHVEAANPAVTVTRTAISNLTIANGGSGVWSYTANGGQGLSFGITGGAEWARLAPSTGNLLIGTTTDSGNAKLQVASGWADSVNGWRARGGGLTAANLFQFSHDDQNGTILTSGGTGHIILSPLATERARFNGTTGNLLIGGTTDGNYKLDVQKSGSTGTLRVYDQTPTTGSTLAVIRAGAGQSGNLQEWQDSNSYRIFSVSPSLIRVADQITGGIQFILNNNSRLGLAADGGSADLSLSRASAGVLQVGDGGSNALGQVNARAVNSVNTLVAYNSTGGIFMAGNAGSSWGTMQSYSDGAGTAKATAINPNGGNVLVGTTTDDGTNKLQVATPAGAIVANTAFLSPSMANGNKVYLTIGTSSSSNNSFTWLYNHSSTSSSRYLSVQPYEGQIGSSSTWFASSNMTVGDVTAAPLDPGFRFSVRSSGSSGTFRIFDEVPTTGVTRAVIRAGAGQSTNALLSINNSADTTLFRVKLAGSTEADFDITRSVSVGANAVSAGSSNVLLFAGTGVLLGSDMQLRWSSTTNAATFVNDLSLSRAAAGVLQVGDGGANANGHISANQFGLSSSTRFIYNTGGGNVSIGNAYGTLNIIGAGENSMGSLTSTGTLTLYNQTATTGSTKLVVRAGAGQSGNLQEWQNSAGTVLGSIDSTGRYTIVGGGTSLTLVGNSGYGSPTITTTGGSLALPLFGFSWAGALDTSLSRASAGVVQVGDGAANSNGTLKAAGAVFSTTANATPVGLNLSATGTGSDSAVDVLGSGAYINLRSTLAGPYAGTQINKSSNTILWFTGTQGSDVYSWFTGSSLTSLASLTTGGTFSIYNQTPTTGVTKAVIRAGAGQSTTNLTEWQNASTGAVLSYFSADASLVLNSSGSGLTAPQVISSGNIRTGGNAKATSSGFFGWVSGADTSAALDTALYRNAAGVLEVNNGTAGTYRDIIARRHQASGETVASLPAAAAGNAGTISYVTDANATTIGSTVAGGGANKVLVWSNGTAWKIFAN